MPLICLIDSCPSRIIPLGGLYDEPSVLNSDYESLALFGRLT